EAAYFGPFFRLLLLLGVRRRELGRATWLEIDNLDAGRWTIPPERTKTEDPLVVPLSPPAVNILRVFLREKLPRGKDYVINGAQIHYARAKQRLDAHMTKLHGGRAIPHLTPQDLRRTCSTGISCPAIAPLMPQLRMRGTAAALRL